MYSDWLMACRLTVCCRLTVRFRLTVHCRLQPDMTQHHSNPIHRHQRQRTLAKYLVWFGEQEQALVQEPEQVLVQVQEQEQEQEQEPEQQ